jgi:hypothetical protein
LAATCVIGIPLQGRAQTQQRYTVTMQNEVAGALISRTDGQGKVGVDFSYRNNGRGPDLKEEFSVDALGAPVTYAGNGRSTFGNEIRETYEWQNGRGRWTSLVDRGDKPVEASALYVPIEGSPMLGAQLVRSLLRRPGLTAPSVAGGKFSVERLAELRLPSPAGDVPLALYALTGVDSTPWYFWLRDHGDKPYFADVSPWMETVTQGFQAHGGLLLARQLRAQTERLQKLQQRLAGPLPGLTVIRNVRWFDSASAVMRGPSDVSVYDGRISAIQPAGSNHSEPAQTIDGNGKTLLPGLFDMHGHMYEELGLFHLAAGVTSVRDPASENDTLEVLREARFGSAAPGSTLVCHAYDLGAGKPSSKLMTLSPCWQRSPP